MGEREFSIEPAVLSFYTNTPLEMRGAFGRQMLWLGEMEEMEIEIQETSGYRWYLIL